ncbi:hypothetical protein ABVT39_020892 [Epinephelus coioides]
MLLKLRALWVLPVNYYTVHHRPTDGGHVAGQLRTMMPSSETTQRNFDTNTTVQRPTSTKMNTKLICGVKKHYRSRVWLQLARAKACPHGAKEGTTSKPALYQEGRRPW